MINPSYLSVVPFFIFYFFDQAVLFMEDEVKGEKLGLCKTCVEKKKKSASVNQEFSFAQNVHINKKENMNPSATKRCSQHGMSCVKAFFPCLYFQTSPWVVGLTMTCIRSTSPKLLKRRQKLGQRWSKDYICALESLHGELKGSEKLMTSK